MTSLHLYHIARINSTIFLCAPSEMLGNLRRFVLGQDFQHTRNLTVVAFSRRYLLVHPCPDAYIGGDSGSPFRMHGRVTVVNGLRNFVPWSL